MYIRVYAHRYIYPYIHTYTQHLQENASQQLPAPHSTEGKPQEQMHLKEMIEQVEHNIVKGAEDLMTSIKGTINTVLHRDDHAAAQTQTHTQTQTQTQTRDVGKELADSETPDFNKETLLSHETEMRDVGSDVQKKDMGVKKEKTFMRPSNYDTQQRNICALCVCVYVHMNTRRKPL
jgi:hypothetical protein